MYYSPGIQLFLRTDPGIFLVPELQTLFELVDEDQDGEISMEEIVTACPQIVSYQTQLEQFDTDRDGMYSLEDLAEALKFMMEGKILTSHSRS